MKKQIIENFSKLLMGAAVAVVLVGTTFALPVREGKDEQPEKSSRQKWTQAVRQIENLSLNKSLKNGGLVSQANQMRFLAGHYLARTTYDALFADLGEGDYELVIEDLEFLSEFFAGTAEAEKLGKLLETVEAGTADFETVSKVIGEIETSYRGQLSAEEDWFLLYGEWMTCLIGDIYLEDDEYIVEDLWALQELSETAPQKVAEEILAPADDLSEFTEQDTFSAEDYEEMTTLAFDTFDLVLSE